jgi:hypothetical protein
MLSLSEDIRILLKSASRKRQPGHTPGNMVFQQVTLMRFEQESFDSLPRQKEQFPVW